ncbi:MAG: uroporphyrinogen decarboxylase family protein [Phycisphaerae bacterium]|nr:uroporphyrinogen decarboxylase family protein [Phycisphaerae bacterium]
MNSRERVEMALNFEQPDRTPVFASFVPEIEQRLRNASNISEVDLGVALGNDMVKCCAGLEMSFYGQPEPAYTDPWGIRWQYVKNDSGVYTEIAEHPLAGDVAKLDSFEIPDPLEESQYDDFRRKKELYGHEKWMIGSSQISIFEACWYLRGLDTFMMDMALEPDYTEKLMDKVMQFPLNASKKYIELGADMVWFGDDVSMQTGMMMSANMWRQYLKPRYAHLFAECKKANPNIKIAYHSCGQCTDILDDMIEIGLDVLNPLQPMAIDPFETKKRYGKRLALFGGLCVQQVMPYGSVDDVRNAVTKLITELGQGGGYILAPAHHIQADTSLENIKALYESAGV